MEQHKVCLQNLCRVCGKKQKCYFHDKNSENCSDALASVFSITAGKEDESIYPPKVCNHCYLTLTQLKKSKEGGRFRETTLTPQTWLPHSDSCEVCGLASSPSVSRGRPRKRKARGRPSADDTHYMSRRIMHHLSNLDTPNFAHIPLEQTHFLPSPYIENLTCRLCHCIPSHPIHILSCQHLLCTSCIQRGCEEEEPLHCPCNDMPLRDDQLTKPTDLQLKVLGCLLLACPSGCGEVLELDQLSQHLESNCSITPVPPPSKISVHQLLKLESSTSRLRTQTMSLLAEEMIPSSGVATCRSSTGKQISLVRLTTPRVESSEASQRTLKRRSSELGAVRELISKGSPVQQLQHELKAQTKEDREAVLDTAFGNTASIAIPADQVLAMKADLSITWNKLRDLRRWMSGWKIHLESEAKERSLAKVLVGPNLASEMVAFSFALDGGGEEIRKAPMAYIPNLTQKVTQLLDQNDRLGRLAGHDFIPSDQIWVKIGGDKGGHTMKFSFQICNCLHPNSPTNTCVFVAFEAVDTRCNLHVAVDRYKAQIDDLKSLTWQNSEGKEFTIQLFMSGDYEFLCYMYGLSGSSGRHRCLICLIPSDDLKKPRHERGRFPLRSLLQMQGDLQAFRRDAGGDLKYAKEYNNVIGEHFMNIDIDHVCLPGLHITLGVYLRLFTLLEDECHKLDLEMAEITSPQTGDRPTFTNYRGAIERERELLDELECMEGQLKWLDQSLTLTSINSANPSTDPQVRMLVNLIKERKKRVLEIRSDLDSTSKKKTLPRKDGPFVRGLDQALASFNVHRQAYHSGSFVGNHIHRALKEVNVKTLCDSVPALANSRCPALIHKAEFVRDTFQKAFMYFSKCQAVYDSGKKLSPAEIQQLEIDIDKFMDFYRDAFHATVTPKLHMLEDHVVPFLEKWGVGLGFLGEHGAESIHARFNGLRRVHAKIPNPVKRLHSIMNEHLLQLCPDNLDKFPVKEKRQFKKPRKPKN